MSGVSAILQQMAENAGRAQLARGQTYGSLINAAANVPAQIMADRERQATIDLQRATEQQRLDLARRADTRATADQAYQDQTRAQEIKDKADWKQITSAMYTPSDTPGTPGALNYDAAIAKAQQIGATDKIPNILQHQRENAPKIVSRAPGSQSAYETGPHAGELIPGTQVPPTPTAGTNEAQIRGLYSKRASGAALTADEKAQIDGYEAEKASTEAPVTVRTVEGGKMVEKVMTRAQALAAGQFPSQPPASVQVNNQPPPPVVPASKAEIAMANYMVPTPSPRSFSTPAGKAMLDRILTVNPDFDASLYAVRAPTRKDYTTGVQGQQLVSMNTAIEHLDQLQAAADALQNGDLKPGNAAYNWLRDQFGSGAPTSFATIKEKVDKELDAVASKGVPTVSGAAAQKAIGGVSASPESIKNYIDTSIHLLGSSQNALKKPYYDAMGTRDPFDPLTPQARSILTSRGFDPDNFGKQDAPGVQRTTGAGGAPKEGDTQPIPGYPGTEQTYRGGKWIRTK